MALVLCAKCVNVDALPFQVVSGGANRCIFFFFGVNFLCLVMAIVG